MVLYGQKVMKSQILRNIDNFIILKFVISRFNCSIVCNLQSFLKSLQKQLHKIHIPNMKSDVCEAYESGLIMVFIFRLT